MTQQNITIEQARKRLGGRAEKMKDKVLGVFRDEGESGGLFDRPGMKNLLSFPTEERDLWEKWRY